MNMPSGKDKKVLASVLAILAVLLLSLAASTARGAPAPASPDKCSGGTINLIEGDASVTIESPQISNASYLGCAVNGLMRIQLAGNDEGGIPIRGRVDSENAFTSQSIGSFNLQVAGLTLKATNSSFVGGKLLLTEPKIKIPDGWGGLEATIPKTFTVDNLGLKAITFGLPGIAAEESNIYMILEGSLGLYSGGYKIEAHGAMTMPSIGKGEGCLIVVRVILYADAFGNSVMRFDTQDGALAADRSLITLPGDQAALIPASMPLRSSYLPTPESLPDRVWQQLHNDLPASPGKEPQALQSELGDSSRALLQPTLARFDSSAAWNPALSATTESLGLASAGPQLLLPEGAIRPAGWSGLVITATAQCVQGIPIGTTGFAITRVDGTISLRPADQYISLGLTVSSIASVGTKAILQFEGSTTVRWKPEFAIAVEASVKLLEMIDVGGVAVSYAESDGFRLTIWYQSMTSPWSVSASLHAWSTTVTDCSDWEQVCYDHHPLDPTCTTVCVAETSESRFHFTGSAWAGIGMAKGQLWRSPSIPYPCCCGWCRKWFIYYPCCRWCWASIEIPPFDIWLASIEAQFGEFTGDQWGFKGTVSLLGFSIGVFIGDTLEFGDVSAYQLIDARQLAAARQAWRAAALSGSSEAPFAGDDTFTFLSDDQVLVRFDLPLADHYRLPLGVEDVITHAQVISQTDTIFSVKANVPLTVTLISPNGVEITPDNYDELPGGYVVDYSQTITAELTSDSGAGSGQARWRFIPASNVPALATVDVQLGATPVFTNVSVDDDHVMNYASIEPGAYTVEVYPAGGGEPSVSAPFEVVTGTDYTVLLFGYNAAELLVLEDDNSQPDPGTGRMRVVNVAPGADPLDVALDGRSFQDVGYRQASDYQVVAAGAYSLTAASGALDPALAAVLTWQGTSSGAKVIYGDKVAWAGDVNGDGYDDLLVADNADDSNRGKVYLYLGTSGEPNTTAAWTKAGENQGDQFGISAAGAGDVDGDGYDDVLIGAYGYASSLGKVYLYLGSADGLSSEPAWTALGENPSDRFGGAVAGVGDVDGDNYDDVLVGADSYSSSRGKAYLFYGSAAGILNEWTPTGSLNAARADHTATPLPDSQVLVAGGLDEGGYPTSSAELYDPATGTFTTTGSLNAARADHTATLLPDGRVLLAGGSDPWSPMSSAELYDPATGTFTTTGSLNAARYDHTATPLPDGRVLVAGGSDGSGDPMSGAELYDPATGTFTTTGSMNAARCHHTATLLPDGRVLMAGGDERGDALDSAELYDPATGTFTITGSLNAAHSLHTANLLEDGQVLVAGGWTADAELYDPATGTFTTTGSMSAARTDHTATRLPDGRVLVAGGSDAYGYPTSSAEFYDPATGLWAPTGSMNTGRTYHTATPLPDGQVLMAGGEFEWTCLSSAELYNPAAHSWSAVGENNNDQFGASLAGAGDVNGDGYDDVLVGAHRYPDGGGLRGKVYTYHGAADGLSAAPSWTAQGEDWEYEFGISVSGAGDVNDDGYDDVLIGAYGYNSFQGKAHLYLGGDPGLAPDEAWVGIGDHVGDRFGASLAGTGDVDGDGYDDVLIGAYGYPTGTYQGQVTLYYGSAAGVAVTGWGQTGNLGIARSGHTAVPLLDGRVLVAGGYDGGSSAELYNPATGQWAPTGNLNTARWSGGHTATPLPDGRVLVAGGWTASAERYDPTTGQWTPTGSLNTARSYHTATPLLDGRVLVAGGEGYAGYLASAELYDPATGTWTVTGNLNTVRSGHTATRLPDGRVLVVGGSGGGDYLSSAELYDPATGLWTYTGSMVGNQTRSRHTATLLADGRVLVAGGEGTGGYVASAELYDPATGMWTTTGSLSTGRLGHTATALADGRVLVVGGKGSGWLDLSSAELYDPATGGWTATGSLNTARWLHTATPLLDGRVLVVAGESGGGNLDSAELFSLARQPWTATGEASGNQFGISVAGGGDANGDGYSDLVVGAPGGTGGRAYLYHGSLGLSPSQTTLAEGDVQTLFVAQLDGSPDALALLQTRDAVHQEVWEVVTTTLYVVDQAITGTWTLNLVGDTEGANLSISAVAAPNPPILDQLTIDASDLANTLVTYRLLSDYRPVTIHIYANGGPVTETTVITLPLALASAPDVTQTQVITLFQGIEAATLVISDPLAVQNALVTTTVDLSPLESGNYKLWVQVEDGVSAPVQGYVWGVGAYASGELPRTWNRVRVAAEGYSAAKQLAGAAQIVIDHTGTWSQGWTTTMTTEIISAGLHVEFTPYAHPDVDSYLLEVEEGGYTHVITTGNAVYYHYDPDGNPVGDPVYHATFDALSPRRTYTVRIAALDLDHGLASWSQAEAFTVPLGDFWLSSLAPTIELPAGHGLVTATLVLTMTEDLFSDVQLALDTHQLPPGISLQGLTYQPPGEAGATAGLRRWQGIPAPARLPPTLTELLQAKAPADDVTLLVQAAISVMQGVPAASYLLPFVGYSGELERQAEVTLLVAEPPPTPIPPSAPIVLEPELPLPSCATAIVVTIPSGAFGGQANLLFVQGSSNVADPPELRFDGLTFALTAADLYGNPLQPVIPLLLTVEYDPLCLGGLAENDLHLRRWTVPLGWDTGGIVCTPNPPLDALGCSLGHTGEFALFEPAALGPAPVYLPLLVSSG